MRNPYTTAGTAFGVGSISQILVGNYFAALATGLFAAGLLFAGIAYLPTSATGAAGSLRGWRNLMALLLAASSIYLFGYDIGQDLYKVTHPKTTKVRPK